MPICFREVLPFMAMASASVANVGTTTLFKAASLKGMSYYVFIVYSQVISTLVFIPAPFILFRRISVPQSLKLPLLFKIFLLAFIGFLAQVAGTKGIEYSSPTLSSAMSNLTPAFTFILAAIFRMEKFTMSSSTTKAKLIGTIVSIAGVLVIVLYKGPTIVSNNASPPPMLSLDDTLLFSNYSDWLLGGLFLAAEYIILAFCYILLSQILKICSNEVLVTFAYTLCGTIISAPICFIAENNLNAWKLRPDITSVAVIYSGILGSSYTVVVHAWGLRLKGPVYVTIFKPFSIAIAAIIGVIFLGDTLHLGIVVGALVISIGVYAVIWGNAIEDEEIGNSTDLPPQNISLLQASVEDG